MSGKAASEVDLGPPLVVYDGACPYCIRQVARMRKRDREGVFRYVPRQLDGLDRRHPRLAEGDFDTGLRVVDETGAVHVGADGIHEVARRLPGWRLAAWLYRVPGLRWLFRRAYAWVARNRHRLAAGCGDGCGTGEGTEGLRD